LEGSLRHLDAKSHPLVLEDDGDSINDTYTGIGLAVDDDLVLEPPSSIRLRKMLFRKSIVPTAILGDQKIGVFLECASQLRACEFLDVDISGGIGVGTERHLGVSICCRH
jgi:hypothetical protein